MKSDKTTPRIVVFSKDWDDVPTSITHVTREMAKTMPVLWINSIGMRKPSFGHSRDLSRIVRRLGAFLRGSEWKENRLRVISLLLVPQARTSFSKWLNRLLFRFQTAREVRRMGAGPLEYWCSYPTVVDLLPKLDSRPAGREAADSVVVYYCNEDWRNYPGVDGAWVDQKEKELLGRVDVVFTPTEYLVEKCRKTMRDMHGRNDTDTCVVRMTHGVEYSRFARALEETTRVPPELAQLPKPVVGFYGNIYPWIDFHLVAELARRRPSWSFVLIGHVYCDTAPACGFANVHFIGRREHADLPAYCRGFDASMIPYDPANPRMPGVNPIKTKELLAAGVPIVGVRIPELTGYGDDVITCVGVDEWLAGLDKQVRRSDRRAISGRVADEDWLSKVRRIRQIVEACHVPKSGTGRQ
ncbi:MAG: hypothetical protein WCL44_04720 [bacterium]